MIPGFFGESLHIDSGLTSVVKGHGHYTSSFVNKKETSTPQDTDFQISKTKGKSILLIRNPYEAIYSYRHYDCTGGMHDQADASKFNGKGNQPLKASPK